MRRFLQLTLDACAKGGMLFGVFRLFGNFVRILRGDMNRYFRQICALLISVLVTHGVWAHGDWKPLHGGAINDGGETTFELVPQKNQLLVYVSDHGQPVNVEGRTAELEMHRTGKVIQYQGVGRGELMVFPSVRLDSAEKISIKMMSAEHGTAFGRFSLQALSVFRAGR